MNVKTTSIIISLAFCSALSGCSALNSGPSNSTVKNLIAKSAWNQLVRTDRLGHDIPADMRTERESATLSIIDHALENKKKYMERAEKRISQVSCSKTSRGSYHCSAMEKIPNQPKKSIFFSIESYGNYWTYHPENG